MDTSVSLSYIMKLKLNIEQAYKKKLCLIYVHETVSHGLKTSCLCWKMYEQKYLYSSEMNHLEKHNMLHSETPSGRYCHVACLWLANATFVKGGVEDQHVAHHKSKKLLINYGTAVICLWARYLQGGAQWYRVSTKQETMILKWILCSLIPV